MLRFPFVCVGYYMTMRYEYEKVLKEELRCLAIETRDRLGITQLEMGNRLQMAENSYAAIEAGRAMCGTLTTVLLLEMQDDPSVFLKEVAGSFAKQYHKELQPL